MASFGRRSTPIWGFPDTTAGTAPAADIVDDARAAESAPGSPRTRTAPKRVIFRAKSLKKPSIDDREAAKSAKRGARRPQPRTNYQRVGLVIFTRGLNTCVRRRTRQEMPARAFMGAIRGTVWRAPNLPKICLGRFFASASPAVRIIISSFVRQFCGHGRRFSPP